MTKITEYPQSPNEWRIWLKTFLRIDSEQGRKWASENTFPFDRLVKLWNEQFSSEHGFSPAFIPALTRNKHGFVKWVYLEHDEPNWSKSDDDQ
jgi:hypothetical protein